MKEFLKFSLLFKTSFGRGFRFKNYFLILLSKLLELIDKNKSLIIKQKEIKTKTKK